MEINFANALDLINGSEQVQTLENGPLKYDVKVLPKNNYDDKEGYFEPDAGEYAPKGSLWNNPQINAARKGMSDEQQKYFESQGKKMYDYDYKCADIDAELKERVIYAEMGLKSGLRPIDLTEEEKDALAEVVGPSWFVKYGFTEEDVYGDEE